MSNLYILNTGEITEYPPHFFEARDDLKKKAMEIAVNLKWTKKIKDNSEFELVYSDNPQVIEYRKLLKQIWQFENNNYIEKILLACDNCKKTENLYNVSRHSRFIDYTFNNLIYCDDCLKHQIELWGEDSSFKYEKII